MSLDYPLGSTTNLLDRVFEAWFEADGARLIVDSHGEVLWANAGAVAVLEASKAIHLNQGRLESTGRAGGPDVPGILARAQQDADAHILCCSEGRPELLATVRALSTVDGMCVVTLRRLGEGHLPTLPDLHHCYGLTAAERAIVLSIMRGATVESIAKDTRISLETVRTHIRHVYAKLNVSSREGLFARLSSSMVWKD